LGRDPRRRAVIGRGILAASALAAALGVASAVEVSMITEADPFAEGSVCTSFRITAIGTYSFSEWPAAFDLIKWPDYDPQSLITCPASGYVSLPNDFGPLSKAERDRIAPYLKQVNFGPRIEAEKAGPSDVLLAHLEKIYDLREKDEISRAFVARYLASQFKDPSLLAAHRQTAFALTLHLYNAGTLKGEALLQAPYLLGYYAWRLDKKREAHAYFSRLEAIPAYSGAEQAYRKQLIGLSDLIKHGRTDDLSAVVFQPPQP
jgi:hypothetical protein